MQKLWQNYKYVYYWLYTWNRGLWGENDGPHFNAAIGMSMSFACLLGSIAVIFELITGIEIIPSNLSKIRVALVGVTFLLSHYFAFVHRGKYKTIEDEFKGESKEERKRKGVWVLLYAFGSMALFIFLIIFGAWMNS